jgi:uncharacterized protein (DUF169 family)
VNYHDVLESLVWNYRLDFDPVGIKFIFDESELDLLRITHNARSKLTFCQHTAAVRQARYALFMKPESCLCKNAQLVLGFRPLDEKADTRYHLKYAADPETALKIVLEKPKLDFMACKGVYIAPIDVFDQIELEPSVVFIMCVPYQALHILNDYMAAIRLPNLTFYQFPNSAVCAGSVWAFNNKTANLTTMCPGSKTSGKTEMNYVNLFIPGEHMLPAIDQLKKRIEKGQGPSLLGKGGAWPGLDRCAGCSTLSFRKSTSQ